ncbi:hypothetical protein PG994_012292 [Apiospora phragmitis]|uniref:Polyketide synthase n=1 Tax=Apiospora phragmitis TaxID=2905665 RepID=A0ABR1TVF4_9PEZI
MLLKPFDMRNPFRRRQEDQKDSTNLTFTKHCKVYASRCRVSWPNLKPLKHTSTLESVEGMVHFKRLRSLFQQQPRQSNVLVIGCKAIARLVWRRRRRARFSGVAAEEITIPTLVIGVGFDSVSPGKSNAHLSNRQSLVVIFEAVRDALVRGDITEYGLEVTLLGLLPAAFLKAGGGLLGHVTSVSYVSYERSS